MDKESIISGLIGLEFSTKEVCRIFNFQRVTLVTWVRSGYLSPSVVNSKHKGVPHRYSFKDIIRIATFKTLLDKGFSRSLASKIISGDIAIKEGGDNP